MIVLTAVTCVTAVSFTTNKLAETAEQSGVNAAVSSVASEQLTTQVAANLGVAPEQLPPEYANLVSESYVTTKTNQLFDQLQAYFDGQGNGIILDLSDLATTASVQGLSLDTSQLQPIVISPPPSTENQSTPLLNPDVTKWVVYIVTAVLLLVSIVLSVIRRSVKGLAVALLCSGTVLGLFALVGKLIDATLIERITFNGNLAELTGPVRVFASTIFININTLYFYQFLGLVAVGALCLLFHKALNQQRSSGTQQPPADKK